MTSTASSTIIANNLLVPASPPPIRSMIQQQRTPVKPVSHFQKLLHHFNGNKSSNASSSRSTPLSSIQPRSNLKLNDATSTVLSNNHSLANEPSHGYLSEDSLPPPPPPEMAHEQLLEILTQGNRARISSISPSPSNSSATTHTSIQRIFINQKKQSLQINGNSISPSMSNSDLSFSPSIRHLISPSKYLTRL